MTATAKFHIIDPKKVPAATLDSQARSIEKKLSKSKTLWLSLSIALIVSYTVACLITPYSPNSVDFLDRLASPNSLHWFGTDHLGRDIATRILYGAGYSVGLALLVASSGALIGTVIGLVCGVLEQFSHNNATYSKSLSLGRFIDHGLMRITDSFFAFPELIAAVAISGLLGASVTNMILALVLLSWMKYCRLVRSLTIVISQEDFVVQARLNRLPLWCILRRHILPNLRLQVLVLWSNSWSRTILAISGLSFLGFGVQPPDAEWGAMLLAGKAYMQSAPHVMIFPGLAILITVLVINVLGDYVHDKLQQPSDSNAFTAK